jgi:hypothetical protein
MAKQHSKRTANRNDCGEDYLERGRKGLLIAMTIIWSVVINRADCGANRHHALQINRINAVLTSNRNLMKVMLLTHYKKSFQKILLCIWLGKKPSA